MDALKITAGILLLVACILLIILFLMQTSKQSGLSSLTGSSDSYFSKNKSKTLDAKIVNCLLCSDGCAEHLCRALEVRSFKSPATHAGLFCVQMYGFVRYTSSVFWTINQKKDMELKQFE